MKDGKSVFRADDPDFWDTQRFHGVNVGTGDTAMQNIADDGHFQIGEIFFVVPDRVHVEQALCGMGMSSVTGIDDVNVIQLVLIQVASDQKRRSGLVVTHNEHVGAHRGQVIDRIQQRFPLAGTGCRNVQVDDVGRQAFGGDFESRPGTGRIFEKEVENAFPRIKGTFLTSLSETLTKEKPYRECNSGCLSASRSGPEGVSARHCCSVED